MVTTHMILYSAGLQGILLESGQGNLQIIGNPRLTDISALDTVLNCNNQTNPAAPVGAIEVIPTAGPPAQGSCLLSTHGQVRC